MRKAIAEAVQRPMKFVRSAGPATIISSAMVASIGTGDVFSKGRDLGAWLGLVPKHTSTGDRTILSSISKRGNRYLRSLVRSSGLNRVSQDQARGMGALRAQVLVEAANQDLHRNVLAIALANKRPHRLGSSSEGRAFECVKPMRPDLLDPRAVLRLL